MRKLLCMLGGLFVLLGLAGCTVTPERPPQVVEEPPVTVPKEPPLTAEQQQLKVILEKNGFGTIGAKPTILVVRKLTRKLTVYRGLNPLKTYPVVLGANPKNDKLCQGDHCTPEGVYRVAAKFDHPRWDKFILLNYPTTENWLKFGRAKRAGKIPLEAQIGGEIGIHGTHDEAMNYRGENWTQGCVSMHNQDINEIYPLVSADNTLIVIKKE